MTIAAYPEPIRNALREIATPIVFDATLTADDRTTLRAGLLDRDGAHDRALAGAWRLVARDGVDDAGIVVHSVLDLFDLDALLISDAQRADAFEQLMRQPASTMRRALAQRLGMDLS